MARGKKGRKPKPDRFATQATLQSLLRYGPEQSGLKELQQQAEGEYTTALAQAQAASLGIQQAIGPARREMRGVYDMADTRRAQIGGQVRADLSTLGPAAGSIAAAAGVEAGTARNVLSEGRVSALNDLSSRSVRASEAAVFQGSQAKAKLAADLQKIFARKAELDREKGAFQALTTSQLREAADARAAKLQSQRLSLSQSERNSMRSAGLDPNTGRPIAQGPLDPNAERYEDSPSSSGPGGRRPASREKHLEYASDVQAITRRARQYKAKGLERHQIVEKLSKGRPQLAVYVDASGNPVPKDAEGAIKSTLSAIPAYKPDVRMSAALDIAINGTLGKTTQRRLQAAGLSIGELGLPSYGQRPRPRRPRRPSNAPGPGGQYRPT